MSGSTPLRLGSTFSVGSPVGDEPPSFGRRSRPTCCQQKLLTLLLRRRLEAGARRVRRGLLDALGDEDLVVVAGAVDVAVLLLPRDPRHRVGARHGGPAGDRRVLGLLVGVDVQRRDARPAVLALGLPRCCRRRRSGWRRSASRRRAPRWARTTRPTGRCARRRRSRSTGPSASTFGSMFSDGPCVTHCPFLNARTKMRWRVAGLLLERRPRHARAAGGERAADDVRDARVLVGVDAGRRVVVDLRAVGRKADHGTRRPRRDERGRHAGKRGATQR